MNVFVWWLGGNNCLMGCKKIGLVENSFTGGLLFSTLEWWKGDCIRQLYDLFHKIIFANLSLYKMPLLCQGMDDSIGKKRNTETDYKLCIICQQKKTTKDLVANPRLDSIENVLSLSRERPDYGDTDVTGFVQRTINETAAIITESNGSYHRSCYKEFANRSKLERVINRY